MKVIEFDINSIETTFNEAKNYLFSINNVHHIVYENFDITTFDRLNKELLTTITKKYIIYCLWLGDTKETLIPKYVGHAKNSISRQRIRAHFTKRNLATGSQLDNIKVNIKNNFFGFSFVEIKPSFMRTSLEEWLIVNCKRNDMLEWNKKV